MTKLKRLTLSSTLISVLAIAAFAGETLNPPCAPGDILTPPCSSQSVSDDSTAPGQTDTPPASPGQTNAPPTSDAVDLVGLVEAALWSLSLF